MNTVKVKEYIILALIVLVLGSTVIYPITYWLSATDETVYVEERYTKIYDNENKYMIQSEDEVFENRDTILFLKFNSSDFQLDLEPESCYSVRVAGWRVPLFSWYRNIVRISEKVECN